MKKIISGVMAIGLLIVAVAGCGMAGGESKQENDVEKITIAYQYGLAYAPALIVKQKNLIEEKYLESTGKEVEITWTQMSSGADINTGVASGNVDVGFMGIAPAITGCMNNVGYKIFTGVSGQEHGIMSNDDEIQEIGDLIGSQKQIALVNTGSIQHIILARALKEQGYDPHALDSNIVAMKHPDGMSALESGNVACQLTTNPYLYEERDESSLHEIAGISDVWTTEDTFVVGVASQTMYDNNQELYHAVCDAVSEAVDMINDNMDDAAALTYELDGNTLEDEIEYMKDGTYSVQTSGIFELAQFMGDAEFIESVPQNYSDLVFENVSGD